MAGDDIGLQSSCLCEIYSMLVHVLLNKILASLWGVAKKKKKIRPTQWNNFVHHFDKRFKKQSLLEIWHSFSHTDIYIQLKTLQVSVFLIYPAMYCIFWDINRCQAQVKKKHNFIIPSNTFQIQDAS